MIAAKLGGLLGGVGLFLLGMHLMTDGLKTAAGGALRSILEHGTRTPLRGILSGASITAVVQSSSAVTVAIIGFVNAGLMTLAQATGVIYGSNVGTTMTGWLVAVVGFKFDIKVIALPIIGIGMGLRVVFGTKRLGAAGMALAGFGIFFIGIDVLNTAFQNLGSTFQLEKLFREGYFGLLLFVGIGFLLTMLMQSSSAAMAVTLTAASGGLIPLSSGAAMVIGANLGTTSTAVLSVIGATPNAKRVAGAHVTFNILTGAVALLILPLFMSFLVMLRKTFGLGEDPAPVLALFHTFFNILGVLLMWPLTKRLVDFLQKRFLSSEEELAKPRYLDQNVVTTPNLAMEALSLELKRIGEISRRMCGRALGGKKQDIKMQETDRNALDALVNAVGEFAVMMRQNGMPESLSKLLPIAMRVSRHYSETAELAENISSAIPKEAAIKVPELNEEIKAFCDKVNGLVAISDVQAPGFSSEAGRESIKEVMLSYQSLKDRLLEAGGKGSLSARTLVDELDLLSNIRRMGEEVEEGARYLSDLDSRLAVE
ncbi:MAG: Na/Pi cotransporter family protein [Deltaproteobacteria bacterium]|nr:Na/Pi cotransporter family protein [Deltaproteobacteria bacterium]